ncbi:hypothetical protein Lal_00039908, partial [Lupinus albus]
MPCFVQNFRSYLCLSGEIRTLSFLLITLTILILHLNLSLEDFRPRISYLRLIVITASDICASYQPCQHNLQAIFITAVTFDVEFVIIKKGRLKCAVKNIESFLYFFDGKFAKSLKIINKSTCLSLPIVKKNLPNQPGGLDNKGCLKLVGTIALTSFTSLKAGERMYLLHQIGNSSM